MDDFVLSSVASKESSPNLIVNSSFEHLRDGSPDYYNFETGRVYSYQRPFEEFLKTCVIDTTEKVTGKNSLKMVFDKSVTWSQGIWTSNTGVIKDQPATFSVFLKADKENTPVNISIWEFSFAPKWHKKIVQVSKEWKRYEITVPSATLTNFRCGVSFQQPGTVWADDLQLEVGEKATPYKLSDNDLVFAKTKKTPIRQSSVAVKQTRKIPAMDGNLDSWIGNAARFPAFTIMTQKQKNTTDVYAVCDAKNLYLGVRAYVKDLSKIKKNAIGLDDLGIFEQDRMEFMIDPGKTGKEYFHFVVSAAGSKTDFGKGRDKAWNGTWNNAVKLNAGKSCIDYEIQFPLSIFAGADILGDWGINIARNDTESGEMSSMQKVKVIDFHQANEYPTIKLPLEILKHYALTAESAARPAPNLLSITINNNTDSVLKTSAVIKKENEVIGNQKLTLEKGMNHVSISLPAELKKDEWIICALSGKMENFSWNKNCLQRLLLP